MYLGVILSGLAKYYKTTGWVQAIARSYIFEAPTCGTPPWRKKKQRPNRWCRTKIQQWHEKIRTFPEAWKRFFKKENRFVDLDFQSWALFVFSKAGCLSSPNFESVTVPRFLRSSSSVPTASGAPASNFSFWAFFLFWVCTSGNCSGATKIGSQCWPQKAEARFQRASSTRCTEDVGGCGFEYRHLTTECRPHFSGANKKGQWPAPVIEMDWRDMERHGETIVEKNSKTKKNSTEFGFNTWMCQFVVGIDLLRHDIHNFHNYRTLHATTMEKLDEFRGKKSWRKTFRKLFLPGGWESLLLRFYARETRSGVGIRDRNGQALGFHKKIDTFVVSQKSTLQLINRRLENWSCVWTPGGVFLNPSKLFFPPKKTDGSQDLGRSHRLLRFELGIRFMALKRKKWPSQTRGLQRGIFCNKLQYIKRHDKITPGYTSEFNCSLISWVPSNSLGFI